MWFLSVDIVQQVQQFNNEVVMSGSNILTGVHLLYKDKVIYCWMDCAFLWLVDHPHILVLVLARLKILLAPQNPRLQPYPSFMVALTFVQQSLERNLSYNCKNNKKTQWCIHYLKWKKVWKYMLGFDYDIKKLIWIGLNDFVCS